jgi:hypothetical protein
MNKVNYLETILHSDQVTEGLTGEKTDWPLPQSTDLTLDEQYEINQLTETPEIKISELVGEVDSSEVNNAEAEYNKINQLPLRELAIKASYNSAYDGQSFTLDQLGKVMASGCRYLDFQLFSASGGILYVGHSDTPNSETVDTTLTFSETLGYLSQYAFTYDTKARAKLLDILDTKKENVENPKGSNLYTTYIKYPLFVNLRINRAKDSDVDIIDTIFTKYLNPKSKTPIVPLQFLYRQSGIAMPVDAETILSSFKRRIIFVMDIDNILQNYTKTHNADDIPIATRSTIQKFVNIKTGGHTWKTYNNYTTVETSQKIPLYSKEDGYTTNSANLYLALPSSTNSANPPAMQFLQDHRIQTSPHRYYIDDTNLEKYEKMFEELKKPIAPLAHVLRYAKTITTIS